MPVYKITMFSIVFAFCYPYILIVNDEHGQFKALKQNRGKFLFSTEIVLKTSFFIFYLIGVGWFMLKTLCIVIIMIIILVFTVHLSQWCLENICSFFLNDFFLGNDEFSYFRESNKLEKLFLHSVNELFLQTVIVSLGTKIQNKYR